MRDRDHQRLEPRGLSRVEAAQYLGISASMFDAMVKDGRMLGDYIGPGESNYTRYDASVVDRTED